MPEWAELRITSDFVNKTSVGKGFIKAEKSDVSKVKTDLSFMNMNRPFTITAESRGKELRLSISDQKESKYLLMFMGMSGGFALISPKYKDYDKVMKHSHLRFYREDGMILCFHDVRRFGKWKWADEWSNNRGFDPVRETEEWKNELRNSYKDNHGFVSEVLMNQKLFSGVGNYLRAEILCRTQDNPWKKLSEFNAEEIENLMNVTLYCLETAYLNQGGRIKDWQNPFIQNENHATPMSNWILCYGSLQSSMIKDKTGRTFWFDPIWNSEVPEKYLKKKHKLTEII